MGPGRQWEKSEEVSVAKRAAFTAVTETFTAAAE
jgi:hypothetical protein